MKSKPRTIEIVTYAFLLGYKNEWYHEDTLLSLFSTET